MTSKWAAAMPSLHLIKHYSANICFLKGFYLQHLIDLKSVWTRLLNRLYFQLQIWTHTWFVVFLNARTDLMWIITWDTKVLEKEMGLFLWNWTWSDLTCPALYIFLSCTDRTKDNGMHAWACFFMLIKARQVSMHLKPYYLFINSASLISICPGCRRSRSHSRSTGHME